MTHKQHYVLEINGKEHHVYCDTLPEGTYQVTTTKRTHKIAQRKVGPNYDGSYNSIWAAILYAQVHDDSLMNVWSHLYDQRGQWVSGGDLLTYGTAALERVRELRLKYGWPIETKPPASGTGVWLYRLVLPPPRIMRSTSKPYDNGQDPSRSTGHVDPTTNGHAPGDVLVEDLPVHAQRRFNRGRPRRA